MVDRIDKKMSFGEVLGKNPEVAEMLMAKGMHCVGCPMAMQESLEEGAVAHGLDPDKLVEDINNELEK